MSQQIYVNDAMESNYKLMNDLNTFNMKYAKYIIVITKSITIYKIK
jgi:hypothetical protein